MVFKKITELKSSPTLSQNQTKIVISVTKLNKAKIVIKLRQILGKNLLKIAAYLAHARPFSKVPSFIGLLKKWGPKWNHLFGITPWRPSHFYKKKTLEWGKRLNDLKKSNTLKNKISVAKSQTTFITI